ncbi:MAG: methyltransferase domain-containing protein [Candidatus Peregrinibacteria bacterium]|nr:methyltransferase domain-containing protein [Candidatus Peregrinibacteria bacterium]
MKDYYNKRASEYEAVYHRDDPVRQRELAHMAATLEKAMYGKRVLEIACGTGYWTEKAAMTAEHIIGVDAASEALEIARSKNLSSGKVDFHLGDAYKLDAIENGFNAGLAMFWFSHVPRARIGEFLRGFHTALEKGSIVFMAENMLQEGIGGELIRKPGIEDTFKRRMLADGSVHEVLKNYYDQSELEAIFSPLVTDLRIEMETCFYRVQYVIA